MASYNDRLFSGGIRGFLHTARFRWLSERASGLDCSNVLELGCFDAKSIDYLPERPKRYVGLDAGWEDGLDSARQRWPQYEFHRCTHPRDVRGRFNEPFSLSMAMETFEHIPPEIVPEYLDMLADVTRGHVLITVPVEFGPVFLGKYAAKHLSQRLVELDGNAGAYTAKEVFNAAIGRTERVRRSEHKGFDYRWLRNLVAERFNIIECSGHPLSLAPRWMNFGVGILAASR